MAVFSVIKSCPKMSVLKILHNDCNQGFLAWQLIWLPIIFQSADSQAGGLSDIFRPAKIFK